MKITTPLLALVGALAVTAPQVAIASPSGAAHLTAKTEKEKRQDEIPAAKRNKQERREDHRERVDNRRDRVQDRQVALREYRAKVRDRQRDRLVRYYRNAYDRNSCPPGLRREYGGCYPRGWNHRREWREGYVLPSTVVYYDLPNSIYGYIDPAPHGYRYVQVGNDILLIDIATRLVVDAFAIY
jgi:hypothetical protein